MHDRNAQPDRLLLRFLPTSSITLVRDDSTQVKTDTLIKDLELRPGYPDNLSFPDILYDKHSREFIGLTFHSTDWDGVRADFADADDRIVEYVSYSVHDPLPTPRLDVRWAHSQSLVFDGAQIADVLFYFRDDSIGRQTEVLAMELSHIGEILTSFKLTFPARLILNPEEISWSH